MKTTKRNGLLVALLIVCLSLISGNSYAQDKYLQTERDGFQWYRLIQGEKFGAQSMGGVTFIPLSRGYTHIGYHVGGGGWFTVEKGDKKEGYCDISGREIIAPGRYDDVCYHEGYILSESDDLWAFSCIKVELNGKVGLYDINGREILPPRYDKVYPWKEKGYKYIRVEVNNKEGIYDINGREIIAPQDGGVICSDGIFKCKDASGKYVSTGIKLSSLTQTPTSTPSPAPMPTPTPTPQPQPQPQPEPQPRQPQPFQVWKTCFMCGGSGQCPYCYGYGWAANGKDACGICHGTGKCSQCAGHGGHNEIEYH